MEPAHCLSPWASTSRQRASGLVIFSVWCLPGGGDVCKGSAWWVPWSPTGSCTQTCGRLAKSDGFGEPWPFPVKCGCVSFPAAPCQAHSFCSWLPATRMVTASQVQWDAHIRQSGFLAPAGISPPLINLRLTTVANRAWITLSTRGLGGA